MTEPAIHLLIVDDEPALRSVSAERLTEQGFHVTEAESGEKALALLNEFAFDIVISDLRLPGIDGHHVIEAALNRYPGIIAIVVTGFGTVKNAVDAIKRGATDFVEKVGMKGFNFLMSDAKRVKALIKVGRIGQKLLVRDGHIKAKIGPLKPWNSYRYAPSMAKKTFRESWKDIEQGLEGTFPELDSVMKARMEKLVADRKDGGGGHHHG